ncbi:MAG: hypothetical protein AAFY60_07095 [Myxococcota bacterium]
MSPVKVLGWVLLVLGTVATLVPEWFAPLTRADTPSSDLFEIVERRVRGGMLLGLGLVLVGVSGFRPWSTSIPSAVFYLLTGALTARVFGIMVDGAVPKQWMLVAIEAALMTGAALWMWRNGIPPV